VNRRAFAWWFVAEDLARALTTPRIDVTAADRVVERAVVESRLGSISRRVARIARDSWMNSTSRSWAIAVANDWRALDSAATLRAGGLTITVAAATTVLVQRLGAGEQEPTTLILPAFVAACGLVFLWLAGRRSHTDGRQRP
jgi:hypothetical protein